MPGGQHISIKTELDEFIVNCERIIDQDLSDLLDYIKNSYDEEITGYRDQDKLNLAGFYKVLIRWARSQLRLREGEDVLDLDEDEH